MAKTAEDKQKWLDAIIKEREQRESKFVPSTFYILGTKICIHLQNFPI